MKDIENIEDIQLLVNTFYEKVKVDKVIGYIFIKTIGDDWSHHLPIMYNFWNMVLFNTSGYMGNPVKKHVDLDKKTTLNKEHFDHWLVLWKETVDRLFAGEIAEIAKNKASIMANLMNMKIEMSRLGFETLN